MKAMLVLSLLFSAGLALAQDRAPGERAKTKNSQTRLICKTGPEKRAPGQALRLYLNYNLPFVFESEDPTMPFGRQVMLLSGRPVVQLFFDKAPGPAGDNGELLQPMQCGFARRPVRAHEPAMVQILLNPRQVHWMSQALGQRNGAERAVLTPAGDWTFAYQYEQVFSVEIDDLRTFVTTQMPKAL